MSSLTITEAKNKRAHIRASATRLRKFIENFRIEQGSRHDITERKQKLAELWTQFDEVQSRIETLESTDETITDNEALLEQQVQQRASFENPYFNLMSNYEKVLEQFGRAEIAARPRAENPNVSSVRDTHIRLPKIDLPVFSGSYEDWYSYQDTFEKLIHCNEGLETIEKFHYLRSSLKEKAADVIKSIETTTDNYEEAWETVKERYDNKQWIVQRHIRAIFEAPVLNKENHIALRELLDTILKHLRALRALKRPTETWDDLIVHIIVSKLDGATNKAWETSLRGNDVPNLKALTDFLTKRCTALENVHSRLSNNQSNNAAQKQVGKYKGASVANVATTNLSCPLCKETHQLYHCSKFVKLSIDERIKIVKKSHLCFNCLRTTSHQANLCHSSACRKCKKKHNTLLHTTASDNSDQASTPTVNTEQSDKQHLPVSTQCIAGHLSANILLSTAIIHVYDVNKKLIPCRALLDSGSQLNFVTQEFVRRAQIEERSLDISLAGVMEGVIHAKRVVNVCVKSRFNNFRENIDCVVLPTITQQLPQQLVPIQNVIIPKNIKLADPNFHIPANIDMLIGAELFWKIICAGQIRQSKNQPILQKTHFGWVISGCTANDMAGSMVSVNFHVTLFDDLSHMLARFWEVEHNPSSSQFSVEEQACDAEFLKCVKRNEEGRYIVRLPVKPEKIAELGESRDRALRRFRTLETRLVNQPNLYKEYREFMQEYRALGYMHEINDDSVASSSHPSYYLPHHAVRNVTSTTTRLRVVFDGSCKTTTGLSLNDALMIGPTLQEDLFSILTRYRIFKIALTADIAKMYRQVLIDSDQTALQRIVWRDTIEEPIKTFELDTVTYGTSSASFLAIRTLRKLAEDYSEQYPQASKIVLRDFYVDDLVTGTDTIEEASRLKNELIQLLRQGNFELRKWASNEPALQDDHCAHNQIEFLLATDKNTERRTLGIVWDCASDSFRFSSIACLPPLENPTKRSILSRVALIFDPLGLLGPMTLLAKTIMQDLWRLQVDWDESIPLEYDTKWKRYEIELQEVKTISIPRRVILAPQVAQVELHGFADASEVAYGACIYLRSTSTNGKHTTSLLCSKSRVAPLKSISLPRLELCAALLLAQLVEKVSKCLPCKIDSTWLWTDSTIVLSWLQSCSRSWTAFVANRVGEIQQLTPSQYWHHVRSEDNPADPLSRGVMPATLKTLHLWWAGPPWLENEREQWPQGSTTIIPEDIPERRTKAIVTTAVNTQEFDIFTRYSNLNKLIRVVAYILRFSKNVRETKKTSNIKQTPANAGTSMVPPIMPEERNRVIERLVKLIQLGHFAEELKALKKRGTVERNSPILKLNPFIDKSGILRVGGRLRASNLPYDAKHPILLPGGHPFSELIVVHEHEKHFHAGTQATLAAVRQRFWLISARNVVKQIVGKCVICFRNAPKPASTIMGNLPEARVTVPTKVFDKCGVDYAGPLHHKEGTRRSTKIVKCYMAIFVCMATKAVHIELALDLSSEAFLNVFKRFIARRGCPTEVFSDNGLNFVGAERELSELTELIQNPKAQQHVIDYASSKGIRWHFIPPRAPHQGGIWEAAVKAAKRHLIRMTSEAKLKYEELETLLIQIEAILNSRPLMPISSDPGDYAFLTPGHFLIGAPITAYPEESLQDTPVNRLSRWQHIQLLRQHFWKRWSREYLHQLQQRNKWPMQGSSLEVGQMVILIEDNVHPLSWSLGRIQETHPGTDGIARVATVRTPKGVYKRPITKLCLLPIFDKKSDL